MKMRLNGNELQVNDEIAYVWFMHGPAQIKSLTPYKGHLGNILGENTQIALFYGSNLEMTMPEKTWYEVTRPEVVNKTS